MKKPTVFIIIFVLCLTTLISPAQAASWQPSTPITSNAVYMVNADTGTVVYEKNANERVYPASITKLMTAILVMEHTKNLDETVTFEKQDTDPILGTGGSVGGFVPGEQITVRQLLFCLLMESANEGANLLARVTGGSVDHFVQMMNAKAKQLGCKDTHFVNPHGLHDPDHYSTAYDCYLIGRYAMSFSVLKEIVATPTYQVPQTNKHPTHTIHNTNLLLNDTTNYYYKYCQGIKTGTTTPAGTCLVSYAVRSNGDTYYCVVMGGPKQPDGSNMAFKETKLLYQWAYSTFNITPLLQKQEMQAEVHLALAWNRNRLLLYPEKQFDALVPKNADLKTVKVVPHLQATTAYAPVRSGQKFGTADVYLDGKKMGTVNLVSHENIARSAPLYFVFLVGSFFRSIWFVIIVALLLLGFVAYLLTSGRLRRKKKGVFKGNKPTQSKYSKYKNR